MKNKYYVQSKQMLINCPYNCYDTLDEATKAAKECAVRDKYPVHVFKLDNTCYPPGEATVEKVN